MTPRRTLTFVIIAVMLGASLALAVALAGSPAGTPAAAQGGIQATDAAADVLAATGADADNADPAAADPAKQEPVLDSFTAKDPFIPLIAPSGGSSGTGGTSGGGSGSTATAYEARVSVNGSASTVQTGDKVPAGDPAFEVGAITSGDVTFKIINGELENGDTSFAVNLGEQVKVKFEGGASYTIKVSSISEVGAAGGVKGHSISVLSISTQGGKAVATLEVDGKTYPDQAVGDVIDTSWGQIKILAISASGQTVTIMHGDQTVTIHAGQVVVK